MNYDIIVIGSGPGGYVAAIRAAQLGKKVALIEKSELGGVCLNWGCIPTKALLKSAQVLEYLMHAQDYGIETTKPKYDFTKIVGRSRQVADGMSKGIQFLMKKNKIDVHFGFATIGKGKSITVKAEDGSTKDLLAKNIIIATGARSRNLPNLPIDGKKVIGYREALVMKEVPKSMVVVGSGAIGVEFSYFYHQLGTEITLVEYDKNIMPREDEEVSKELHKVFTKKGIKILTGTSVEGYNDEKKHLKVFLKNHVDNTTSELNAEVILSAVGIEANIENIGLEPLGIKVDKGRIVVDENYQTNIAQIYAIGDVINTPALAHVASAEAIHCVEHICGLHVKPIDYTNIPGCTYCVPEIASLGLTEAQAKKEYGEIKVGKFPFSASGKASASGHKDGFVKLIFDAKYGELLGAHMIGANVTEMIASLVVAKKLETTGHELIKSIHPHPTMSEAVMEAAAAAYGEVIHL
ncbi:MAG: dihydrolipoyl dehydrogenase [Chitinophagales bacterium]|jgi:dihydrolipoamide dehydrogenase|nr:dihydrolipoyl dehydrogenase [Chitinophagales bacterium]